jgi:hypothetical protein
VSNQTAATIEHDLPMLRVHRAWEAAEKIAEAHGIDRSIALAIARKAIDIIGGGTKRWGHLCTECRSQLTWENNELRCPQHGFIGPWQGVTLLISFDPIGG